MFTTLSHPGAELSDAANMAYSSILQSQQANGAAAQPGGRAQLSAAATQPQYLFSSPGSGGPVMISQAQAMRLQQQQQQQNRGGGRGSLPQVDGVLEEEAEEGITRLNFVDDDDRVESQTNSDEARRKDSLHSPRTDFDVCPPSSSSLPDCSSSSSLSPSASATSGLSLLRPIQASVLPKDTSYPFIDSSYVDPGIAADRRISESDDDAAVTITAASGASSAAACAESDDALSFSPAAAELCLPSGKHLPGRILNNKRGQSLASARPKKGDKIEIVFQVDGNHSSSDDDDDDDDDGDLNEDDSSVGFLRISYRDTPQYRTSRGQQISFVIGGFLLLPI